MKLATRRYEKFKVTYRPGTSDENALREVIERRAYVRQRDGFDVQAGERWLDLGANIGAFAVYCAMRGARVVCFEPDPDCFALLKKNAPAGAELHQAAVTDNPDGFIDFYTNQNPADHYRGTTVASARYRCYMQAVNRCAGFLKTQKFDGVKMDIEGSEFGLLDGGLLPKCEKLVFEYHSSKDKSLANFQRRMRLLRKRFANVKYPSEFDKQYELARQGLAEDRYMPFVDRIVFAWGAKS